MCETRLAFGIHRCLGSNLARLELKVAVEEFVRRFPSFTVDGDTASGIWAMDDRIWFPGGATLIGSGWYEETYRRAADGWLIATMRLRRHRVELDGVVIFPPN